MYVYVCVHSEYVCTDVVYFYLIPIFPTRCCGTPFSVLFRIVVQCYCILPPKVLTGSPETEGGCSRLSSPLPVLSSVQFSLVLAFHLPRSWLRVYVLAVNGDWCPAGKFSAHKTLKYIANTAAGHLQQREGGGATTHIHTHTHTVAHLDLFNASGGIVNASLCVFMSVLCVAVCVFDVAACGCWCIGAGVVCIWKYK